MPYWNIAPQSSKSDFHIYIPDQEALKQEVPQQEAPIQEAPKQQEELEDAKNISDTELPSDMDDFIVLDEADSETESVEEVSPSKISVPLVFDSHFHLDMTSHAIWGNATGHSVEEVLTYSQSEQVSQKPDVQVQVVGGVAVYNNPNTYPKAKFFIHEPWKVAIGVHPNHIESLTTDKKMLLQSLLDHPKVVAFGSCGLDRTVPVEKWSDQDDVLRQMLKLAKVEQPLIVHVEGPEGDKFGTDVHCRCILMMEKECDSQQQVHVHNFKSTAEIVEIWLRKFPNTYFSVTGAVLNFNSLQIAGLEAIPADKLLLESDAPHHPVGDKISTPACIGDIAAVVAVHLCVRPSELMQRTLDNAYALYGP